MDRTIDRRSVLGLVLGGAALAGKAQEAPHELQGMIPRASAAGYMAQGKAGKVTIAADFTGHGIPTAEQPLSSEDHVAVEVALYGAAGQRLMVNMADFKLKVNGKKELDSQPWGLVAKEIKDPEWMPPEPEKEKSAGGISTGGGGGGRQPGDPPPLPPKVPIELLRSWQQLLRRSALAEGERELPLAGMLFFHERTKLEKIKSVELIYEGPAGKAKIRLQ